MGRRRRRRKKKRKQQNMMTVSRLYLDKTLGYSEMLTANSLEFPYGVNSAN
jgi:hypothetical protein